jgi:putative inorganic carbon (HCO3(-)) transporter
MAVQTTRERENQILHWDYGAHTRRESWARWMLVGAVGIGLGLFVAAVSTLPSQYTALLVLAFICLAGAVIVGSPQRLFLAVVLLDIPFHVGIHLNYQNNLANLGALGGLDLSVTTIALVFLYGLWFIEQLTRRTEPTRHVLGASLFPLLYLVFAVLSLVVARDVELSFFEVFLVIELVLLYIYLVGTVHSSRDIVFVVAMLLVGLLLESVLMIGLYFVRRDFSFAGINTRVDYDPLTFIHYRVAGTVGSPNTAGGYLSMLLAPAFCVLLIPGLQGWLKWLGLSAFATGMVALVLTFSRGAWMATFISLVLVALFAWKRGWLDAKIPLTLVAVTFLVALPFAPTIAARLLGDDRGAGAARLPLDVIAWRMVLDHPLLGVGLNNYVLVMQNYVTPDLGQVWLYVAHNRYLLLWAEMGIGGFLVFVLFLLSTLRRGWAAWQFRDRLLSTLALALTAGLLGHMAHMLVEIFNGEQQQELLFVVAALIVAISRLQPEAGPAEVPAATQRHRSRHSKSRRAFPGVGISGDSP